MNQELRDRLENLGPQARRGDSQLDNATACECVKVLGEIILELAEHTAALARVAAEPQTPMTATEVKERIRHPVLPRELTKYAYEVYSEGPGEATQEDADADGCDTDDAA